MKKNFFLALAALPLIVLCSCTSTKPFMAVMAIDYASVTKSTGVFLSESNTINKDYDAIGSVLVVGSMGYETEEVTRVVGQNRVVQNADGTTYVEHQRKKVEKVRTLTGGIDDGLTAAANKATSMGANAIINLRVATETSGTEPAYTITGMAIKIK